MLHALSITRALALPDPFPLLDLGFTGVTFLGCGLTTGFWTTGGSSRERSRPDATNAPANPLIRPNLGANRTALRPDDCFMGTGFCVGGVDTDDCELTVLVTRAVLEDAFPLVLFPLVLLVTIVFDDCLFEDGLLLLGVFVDGLLPLVLSGLGTDGEAGLLL
jgi:hypothetical protein